MALPNTVTEPSTAPAAGIELPLPQASPALQKYLSLRRSVSANDLGEPGPNAEQLTAVLRLAARVPDHKKLAPWRFIVLGGEARAAYGARCADILKTNEPEASDARLEIERNRFMRAPVIVVVVSRAADRPGVPEWEQILSAGAVCLNLLHAAASFGFGGNWITEWCSYDAEARAALGLSQNERVAGFVYIGTPRSAPKERERPDLASITTFWRAPDA